MLDTQSIFVVRRECGSNRANPTSTAINAPAALKTPLMHALKIVAVIISMGGIYHSFGNRGKRQKRQTGKRSFSLLFFES
jgi:hypothetical protein